MKEKLWKKVKDLTKDNGLSEKYLKAVTERLSGSLTEESTDEEIENTANLIAEMAKETQSEATKWVNTKKSKDQKTKSKNDEEDDDDNDNSDDDTSQKNKQQNALEKRLKAMEEKLAGYEAKEKQSQRLKDIATAMEKHKIPTKFRERLAKTISDDEDIEEAVSTLKQDFIIEGLQAEETEGSKAASEKQIDESADALLESITVK